MKPSPAAMEIVKDQDELILARNYTKQELLEAKATLIDESPQIKALVHIAKIAHGLSKSPSAKKAMKEALATWEGVG